MNNKNLNYVTKRVGFYDQTEVYWQPTKTLLGHIHQGLGDFLLYTSEGGNKECANQTFNNMTEAVRYVDNLYRISPPLIRFAPPQAPAIPLCSGPSPRYGWPTWMGEHPRRSAPWTDEERILVMRKYNEGATLEYLVKLTGRQPSAVESRIITEKNLPAWKANTLFQDRPCDISKKAALAEVDHAAHKIEAAVQEFTRQGNIAQGELRAARCAILNAPAGEF